jgi:hypothetical protein
MTRTKRLGRLSDLPSHVLLGICALASSDPGSLDSLYKTHRELQPFVVEACTGIRLKLPCGKQAQLFWPYFQKSLNRMPEALKPTRLTISAVMGSGTGQQQHGAVEVDTAMKQVMAITSRARKILSKGTIQEVHLQVSGKTTAMWVGRHE